MSLSESIKANLRMEFNLSEEEILEHYETFSLADTDGSGSISVVELGKLLKSMGQKIDKNELEKLAFELDKDHSGEIDFSEYVQFMEKGNNKNSFDEKYIEKVIKAFECFDCNQDGEISIEKLKNILCNYGENTFSNEQCEIVFRKANINNLQKIDYKECIKNWIN